MSDREKLIKLMFSAANYADEICIGKPCSECYLGAEKRDCTTLAIADHLISNGVTVQKWIPVSESLPDKKQDVLMYFDTGNMAAGFWHDEDEIFTFWCAYTDDGFYTDCDCVPTHWMPLPEPPKECE